MWCGGGEGVNEQWSELLSKLPLYLGGHMVLSASALAVGLLVSLPLGIFASRRPRLAEWTLGVAGVIQTVPSLALLALMVPFLGGMIGFEPAFVALTLYSILPILANTVIGIRGVDPAMTEAAQGLGMSQRQMLLRVQLPLAAPVIIAGVRTATVLVVGTATLVTPVGGRSLGNYIFGGLESLNHAATIFGCVMAAGLALVLDQLIRLLEIAATRRSRARGWVGAAGLLLVVLGSLYYPTVHTFGYADRVVIASGPFTEQHILNEMFAIQLSRAGFHPDQRPGMSEGIQLEALFHGQVDCIVNYSGNVWNLVMKRADLAKRETAVEEITRWLRDERRVVCLGSLGFEDAYAFAMPAIRSKELQVHTLADLARYAAQRQRMGERRLRIGGDNQFFGRPEWRAVQAEYDIPDDAVQTVAMDPTLMYGAVVTGQVDAIVAYTSDGRIPAYKLALLEDPRHVLPPYDALVLLSEKAARNANLSSTVKPLLGAISLEAMQEANYRVDVAKWPVRRAAKELLDRIN
jgi:osmoprotectant transport system permease protein